MPRSKTVVPGRARRKKVLKTAKGGFSGRSKLYKTALQTQQRAGQFAYEHRRLKKRQNRSLAILRINAASTANGMSYSRLMHGLRQAGIGLDRKSLSELAVREPAAFAEVVGSAKAAAGA